jgi:hypothetical protein
MQLDLPRDDLVEWVQKQLAGGVRNVPYTDPSQDLAEKLERLLKLKRDIVKMSRQVAERSTLCVSEKWRSVEIKHSLVRAQYKLQYASIDDLHALSGESETVWNELYAKLDQIMKRREKERGLMEASLNINPDGLSEFLSTRRTALLDEYLQERFLLKKQKESRKVVEQELREKIASLSSELHGIRDLHRVKKVFVESRNNETQKQIEASERMIEWQLMEEQLRLEREMKELDAHYVPKIERMRREIAKVSDIANIEAQVVDEKTNVLDHFKADINVLRGDIRDIETAVSQFRTVLRKEAKIQRDQAKAVRE